jgi:hypothetical protein
MENCYVDCYYMARFRLVSAEVDDTFGENISDFHSRSEKVWSHIFGDGLLCAAYMCKNTLLCLLVR